MQTLLARGLRGRQDPEYAQGECAAMTVPSASSRTRRRDDGRASAEGRLGDSSFPVPSGSGGQWGGNNWTAGVYAACVKLRQR